MCGIAGWADLGCLPEDREKRVRRMTDAMASRGPDGAGVWTGTHAVLGHRRLAVMDPEHGQQPMIFTDDRHEPLVAMTYSGEVYNHPELREELQQRGHKFRTGTDTEVVLHAYLEWGIDAVERLNGMYAFAIWDEIRGRLVLVRDRLGVKPLHYARHAGGVLFASEPKSLFASGLIAPAVSVDGLRDLFASAHTPGATLFRDVHEVRPGTIVVLDAAGLRERHYWQLTARPHDDDVPATVGRVRELLSDIAARHVRADVPLGALLSGGLDSSALVALGQQAGPTPLRTFSVDFAGNTDHFVGNSLRATPDTLFVRAVAEHCGLDHRDIVLDAAELADPRHRQAVVAAKDAPALGDMDTSLYLLFRAVREHTTVTISGESADEVFGGYAWFHDPERIGAQTYPWRYFTGHSGTYQALLRPEAGAELDIAAHREAQYRDALAGVPRLDGEAGLQRRMREVFHLHLTRWLPHLLDRKDRLSMAVGLEVRVPFCDHRLVEYAFNIPWALHTVDGREKSLLRAAVAPLLPASVTARTKAPYPVTHDPAYHHAISEQAHDLLATPTAPVWSFLAPQRLRDRLNRPAADHATRAGIDFALNFDLWLRNHTGHNGRLAGHAPASWS
ncbi:asparagine synthase (glutamine-hydrolyzing) [Amycolatopsis keratiniphila]|uniref:asparagine synthase (glutamine-hydrolyzing) n=1 Tax=Amycolatopsis keratiniphila TaxID=129921 RepID=UPI000618843F|nr:asparagine synthase (glutamine-hydrolyzing) [Amycolatopsis keratiniphila]